jgi:hypothetical protein
MAQHVVDVETGSNATTPSPVRQNVTEVTLG